MKGWLVWFLSWIALLVMAVPSRGQEVPMWIGDRDLPPPPAFGVLDEAGFYSRNPEGLRRISDLLRGLEQRHGFKIYLVIETVLDSTSHPAESAAKLYRAWLPEGNGLVVVYQKDSSVWGISQGTEVGGATNSIHGERQVPSYESTKVILKVEKQVDPNAPPEVLLEDLVTKMVAEYDRYFLSLEQPKPKGYARRIFLVAVGGISVLGLLTIGLVWLVRRLGIDAPQQFRFPEVEGKERLGAPYGGGVVISRRFDGGRDDASLP